MSDVCAMPSTLTGLSVNSLRALQRNDQHGRRAVADQRAIVNGQRIGDGLAGQRLLHSDHFAHVRQRILGAVGVILYRHRGHLLARGSVLIHVPARDHREQRRERRAGAPSPAVSPAPGQNFGDFGRGLGGHLLHARDQHDVVQTRPRRLDTA